MMPGCIQLPSCLQEVPRASGKVWQMQMQSPEKSYGGHGMDDGGPMVKSNIRNKCCPFIDLY